MVNFFTDRLYREADSCNSSHITHTTHASHSLHASHGTHSLHTTGTISDDMLLYCLKDLHRALASPGTHVNTLIATNTTDTTTPTTPTFPMNDATTNTTTNNITDNNNNGGADAELENDLIMQLRHQLLSSSVSPPIESLLVDYSPRLKYIG